MLTRMHAQTGKLQTFSAGTPLQKHSRLQKVYGCMTVEYDCFGMYDYDGSGMYMIMMDQGCI